MTVVYELVVLYCAFIIKIIVFVIIIMVTTIVIISYHVNCRFYFRVFDIFVIFHCYNMTSLYIVLVDSLHPLMLFTHYPLTLLQQ